MDKPVSSASSAARSAAIAFPAVRGEVCVGKGKKKLCESWAPCPEVDQCQCEYYYGDLYCFDEDAGFNKWKGSWVSYPETANKKWIGKWWALNDTVPAGYSIDINERNRRRVNPNLETNTSWFDDVSVTFLL